MIISKIQGGLGNQMFQYSVTRHLSIKYNTKINLDTRFYDTFQGGLVRKFLLDQFKNTKIDTNFVINSRPICVVDDFNFKNIEIDKNFIYYLDGFWQSEKYFKDSEEIIRNDFSPMILPSIPQIETNTISLHVRRSDYLSSNGYHPVQTIDYYKNAIDLIGDYDNIFIFSDDINWCRENLKFDRIIFFGEFTEIEDLHLMSMCKHNVIANSSFSWWGAWLNKNPDKKVIVPKKWFGDHVNLNTSDLIPDSWIKI